MFDLKDILPTEALLPFIAGGTVWFGANYLYIGPEMIGPRLAEVHFAPACTAIVEQGRTIYAAREQDLIDQFNAGLESQADAARGRVAAASDQALEMAFGDLAPEMMALFGDQMMGSAAGMIDLQLQGEIEAQRKAFQDELAAQRAAATSAVIYPNAEDYCGCMIHQTLSEEAFDLASYTASLRLFTPPTIRNIETGATYNVVLPACGAMPVL